MLCILILVFWVANSTFARGDHNPNYSCDFGDAPTVTQITEPIDHSETPSWDGRRDMLYYVDVHTGRVLSYNYDTGKVHSITLGSGSIGPVVQTKNKDVLLVGFNRSIVAVEWDGKNNMSKKTVLTQVSDRFPDSHFNDGKTDKNGRLWWGTMGLTPDIQNQGALYKITSQNLNKPDVVISPVNVSNGLAWNKANDKFYYINFPARKIFAYDFNLEKGEISNQKVVFDLEDHKQLSGKPDGMTIDIEDNLWIALFGGGSVIKVNPTTGQLLNKIAIPAQYVTDTMFGGPNLDILFVTTFKYTLTDEQKKQQPAAGALFAVKILKTKGRPVFEAFRKCEMRKISWFHCNYHQIK
ncbi:unnamed protein product [Brassicogethes aeneus]|uniref:SMP-30/Gluconolactonase/LRE-like region domain-containing protein n=1 Tax=Brassicogethes aeneus TaxID=1431903 RepID=A0A9P0FIS5_BRAAE|nr:unnamed protein product [Brassicogethes aeneus]